jgi:hypothetical protein
MQTRKVLGNDGIMTGLPFSHEWEKVVSVGGGLGSLVGKKAGCCWQMTAGTTAD